jgi:hypothetical protein
VSEILHLLEDIGGRVDEAEVRYQLERAGEQFRRRELARLLAADQVEITIAITAAGQQTLAEEAA